MRSVADEFRRDTASRSVAKNPAERVQVALELGERDLKSFADSNGLTRREALQLLRSQRLTGRRFSRCAARLLE